MASAGTAALGQMLAAGRAAASMTQAEVAASCGVHPITVVHWEKGRWRPGHETLGKLAELYGIPLDRLYFAARVIPPDMADYIRHSPRLMANIRAIMEKQMRT